MSQQEFNHDKAAPLSEGAEFDRPMCPVGRCRFILEDESPKGYADLADHEWHCPNHGTLLADADSVQRRCSHCGEFADSLPESYHGEYETPDGETYYVSYGTHMHPECADEVIEALESGRSPATLGDFA
jgi:hypothetical protein